jgi:hypothetical protein
MAEAAVLNLEPTESTYRFVDDIPEVNEARLAVREQADAILDAKRGTDAFGVELLPVDALSTARAVLAAEPGSSERIERRKGLSQDCQRLVGEWWRKLTSEYFAPLRQVYKEDVQDFFSHGFPIGQMTENALVPLGDDVEEEARRGNEFVEHKTPQIVRSLGAVALGTTSIRTVSECPDTAIAKYGDDKAAGRPNQGYWGYVPEIQKVMIRDIRLDDESNDRFEEQIAVPGTYITHEIIQMALAEAGLDASHMDKTELHGAQMIAQDGLMDFARLLDTVASEQWCVPIFMGEEVDKDHPKDYEQFKREALARQESLTDMAEIVAVFILDLAEDDFDPKKAPAHVEDFVKSLLLDEAKKDRVVALTMFDEKTADGLQEVVRLEAMGEFERANDLFQEVGKAAPGGGFCGAGSCGLESVNTSTEAGKILAEKLHAKPGDKIVKDKERACKCGSKSVAYAYNSKKVNKYCESCGAFESKQSRASATATKSGYALAA